MAGKNRYLNSCQVSVISPLPATESNLKKVFTFLTNEGLKHQSIKCYYLSTVINLQVECWGGDSRVESMPLLELALRRAKREQAGSARCTWLPNTPGVLEQLWRVWNRYLSIHDHIMFCAVCYVGFFGFLHQGR